MAGVFQHQQQEQQRSFQNSHRGKDKDTFKVDDATLEWPFTTKIIPDPIVDWSKPPIYDEYTEDGLLIVQKKNGSINNSQEPTFSSKTALVLTKRKSEENDEHDLRKRQTRLDNKITYVDGVPLMVSQSLGISDPGLATDEFTFVGFLPKHDGSRRERLIVAANETAMQIFFVPPHKLCQFIEDAASFFGEQRQCVIAQEMPKIHEEFWRGTLGEAKEAFSTRQPKGEITFLVKVKMHFDRIESPIFDGKTTIIVEEVFKANDEFQMHGGSFEQLHALDPFWNSIEVFASKNPWVTYLEQNLKEIVHPVFGNILKFRYEKINFKYKSDADKIRRSKLFLALETRGRVFSTGGE